MRSTPLALVAALCGTMLLGGIRSAAPGSADPPADWTLSREAGEALAAHGRDNAGAMCLTWPRSWNKRWSASEIPEAGRKEALAWIRKVLRDDVIPADLADRLVGMRCEVYPKPPKEVDGIWARYEHGGVRVQICEHERGMAVLVEPLDQKPPAALGWLEAPQYALRVYGRAFRLPQIPLQHVNVYLRKLGDRTITYCGVLRLDPNKDYGRGPDTRRYWHDQVELVIDGPKVGFLFMKHDGEPDEVFTKARPSPPSGTRW